MEDSSVLLAKISKYAKVTMIASVVVAVLAVGAVTYATVKYFQVRASVNESIKELEDTFNGLGDDLQDGAAKEAPNIDSSSSDVKLPKVEITGYNTTDPQRYRLDALDIGDCFQATIDHKFSNNYYLEKGALPYGIDANDLVGSCAGGGSYIDSDKGKLWIRIDAVMQPDTEGYAVIMDQLLNGMPSY